MSFATLGLITGVLCICLGVGMIAYQKATGKRPGVSFWAIFVVLAPLAYFASFVLAVILDSKGLIPGSAHEVLEIFYAPITLMIQWCLWKLGIELD